MSKFDTREVDVLVVGAGVAGFSAALEAADHGCSVLLVEKEPEVGGSTVLSGGSMAFAGTRQQEEAGIEDSTQLLLADMQAVGQGLCDPVLLATLGDHQLEAYHWLKDRAVEFGDVQGVAGQSVPRTHPVKPRQMIEALAAAAASVDDIEVAVSTPARRLLTDPTGRVEGIALTESADGPSLRARRGVVLTSGGFARNKALVARFAPLQSRGINLGGPGNVGDGLLMAWALGADVRDLPYIKGTFGNHPRARATQHTASLPIYLGAIVVNEFGERFVNEALDVKTLGDAVLGQPGAHGYQIYDAKIMDQAVPGYGIFDFARRIEEGLLVQAATLAELAAAINVPADTLASTVSEYNQIVDGEREDRFGRTTLAHSRGNLARIDAGPFYAYESTSGIVATYCGLAVTTRARVQDVFGHEIAGLSAAGEIIGGIHGAGYMTGSSLVKSVVFGRIAGRDVATR